MNPETLLMPGKLSAAHRKLEQHCSLCHDLRDRSRETGLCLACHKHVAADIRERRGLHGHTPAMAASECRACHVEHLGRSADIVELDPARFNHDLTDFPLSGAHRGLACAACHLPHTPLRAAPRRCVACHKADDPHGGGLGADCASCHGTAAWEPARFDHDRTSFPLRGAHDRVACVQCHVSNRYKGTPRACVSCHAPDDVHAGDRGPNCAACHSVSAWKSSRFDHAKETRFALLGAHARLACDDCHRSGNMKAHIPRHCSGCHAGQDPHAGRLGKRCDRCHGNEHWKPSSFDHLRQAHWALTGAHLKLGCFDCHTADIAAQKLNTACASCHAPEDVHRGNLGTHCGACHETRGWLIDVRFEHDRTGFPLTGLHVAVPCAQCHLSRAFRGAPTGCAGCHARDDVHKGGFGHDCARCHSPDGWGAWRFDHARETRFALTGAHATLACSACHRRPAGQVKLPRGCAGCHSQDDVHLGQFGRDCDRCHTTLTFKGAEAH